VINDNERTLSVDVADDGKAVIIGTPDGDYFFSPEMAVQVANTILQAVGTCGFEVKIEAEQSRHVSDLKRSELIVRCDHILRTLKGKPTMYIAKHAVDTVLTAIL